MDGYSYNILIAIVTHDRRIDAETAVSLLKIVANCPPGWRIEPRFYMQRGQAMTRSDACNAALDEGFTHVWFLDGDLTPAPQNLVRLVESGYPLVGGIYALKKRDSLTWCANRIHEDQPAREDANGFQEVREVGTGMMLIRVDLLRQMVATGEVDIARDDDSGKQVYEFFQFRPVEGRRMSEDWYFCDLVYRLTRVRPWVDVRSFVRHIGYTSFPLPHLDPTRCPTPAQF
jgi:hypothetical protein